ncbi:tetratricopeptide repeat domain-containing protein [Chloropicon primus]|uniref:Tetratricopeptide repeat domain-containing protein n=1 Tax=Chloropicon primus TaxID=1764295 RepID=A0A5B8MC80_9CHLO|nr:tetratricopeptide repeat domain-containing protein [Chloropicon primus]|eukprot:QDZ17711.1 tetratricopeptide repeat domain-containing protein [Chloropicon primus]
MTKVVLCGRRAPSCRAEGASAGRAKPESVRCASVANSSMMRQRLLLEGVSAALLVGTLVACEPALARTSLEDVFPNFSVNWLGLTLSHQRLVEALVFGQGVGFIGSVVTGIGLRKRKAEVQRLNDKLLEVSKELRKQTRAQRKKLRAPAAHNDDGSSSKKAEVLGLLKSGKLALKENQGQAALECFSSAMSHMDDISQELESPWRARRKVLRGLGAANAALGRHDEALDFMKQVVDISENNSDFRGLGDAYGVIADLYTEMGDYEEAAKYYDLYISSMDVA